MQKISEEEKPHAGPEIQIKGDAKKTWCFKAHWAIINKQMTDVWTFDLESETSQLERRTFSYDSDIESNWVTSADLPSKKR